MKKWIMTAGTMIFALGLAGCNDNNTDETQDSTNENTANQVEQDTTQQNTGTKPDLLTTDVKVNLDEAINKFKDAYPNADITGIEMDNERDTWKYEISGMDDKKEYEYEVNADSGVTKATDEEQLDGDETSSAEREAEKLETDGIIQPDQAIDTAVKETEGQVEGWSLEREGADTYYEVTIRDAGNNEKEFLVDAKTGDLVK
ncbi:PepSY domain-containing protein [Bacillus massiliglaciei]|uniref:PepSY domain-containing protein n=1 Tax=Bacillus massiliglaciei TaxID=1816693 RepID=UPI000DA62CBD|nr:PepSY domain-containing protein [Bacillus massiliglaciei]